MRISCGVRLRRRPPSLVTVTMSSMRTPKRFGEIDAGFDREAHAGLDEVRLAIDHVRRLVGGDADAVSGPVDEVLSVAGFGDHGSWDPIDLLALDPGWTASKPACWASRTISCTSRSS